MINIGFDISLKNVLENDYCLCNIPRVVVENGDSQVIDKTLAVFKQSGRSGKQKLCLLFDGYDDVIDEIYEIQEIRSYCQTIVKKYPWIFYYLSNIRGLMEVFVCCISDVTKISNPDAKPISQFSIEELLYPPITPIRLRMADDIKKLIWESVIEYCHEIGEEPSVAADILAQIPC